MANIFQDINRSGGLERATDKLSDTVLAMRKDAVSQEALGLERAKTEATLTTEKLNQESIANKIRSERVMLAEQEATQKELDKRIPLASLNLESDPNYQVLYNKAKTSGYVEDVEGVEMISKRNRINFKNDMNSDLEFQKILTTNYFMSTNQKIREINNVLADPKTKPEDAQKLKEQVGQLTEQSSMLADDLTKFDSAVLAKTAESKQAAERELNLQKLKGEQAEQRAEIIIKGKKSLATVVAKNGGKIGATKERLITKVSEGGMKSLMPPELEALAIILKDDPVTRRSTAIKIAQSELTKDPRYKTARTKEAKNAMLRERINAIEVLLNEVSFKVETEYEKQDHPLSTIEGNAYDFTDEELLKIIDEE